MCNEEEAKNGTPDKPDAFKKQINLIHAKLTAEANPQKKRILSQKLIVLVWEELNLRWAKKYAVEEYSEEIIKTVINCLQTFDGAKGNNFTNYLLVALKHELTKVRRKADKETEHETPLYAPGKNGEEILLPDIVPLATPLKYGLNAEERLDFLSGLKTDLAKLDAAINMERENKETKSALLTRNILEILCKTDFYKREGAVIAPLGDDFPFINKTLWHGFFERGELPTQKTVAAACGCNENRASQMINRFLARLKKSL